MWCRYTASRARGSSPSPSICWMTASSSPASRLALKSVWSSRSAGMIVAARGRLHQTIGDPGLVEQHGQRGDIRVPLDQRGNGAESIESPLIELPHRRGHGRAMVIDEDGPAVRVVLGMAGEMDLAYGIDRQRFEVCDGIEAQVPGCHVNVIDVTEETASRAMYQLGQELGLLNGRVAEPEVARWVLDQ